MYNKDFFLCDIIFIKKKVMNRSISKIRHLQEANRRLERKFLREQDEKVDDVTITSDNEDGVTDLEGVEIIGDKMKSLCTKLIKNLEDVVDELEDLEDSEDIQTELQDNYELLNKIKEVTKDLTYFTAKPFKNDNPFGL